MKCAIVGLFMWAVGISAGFSVGNYRAPLPPVVKTTDQQCVAWLFEANMKDVKKKVCKK